MNAFSIPEGGVRTLSRRLASVPAPLQLFSALTNGGKSPNTVLLESAVPSSHQTQRSLLVVSSALCITCRDSHVEVSALNSNGKSLIPCLLREFHSFSPQVTAEGFSVLAPTSFAESNESERMKLASPLSILRRVLARLQPEVQQHRDSILLVGLFAYDLVDRFEVLPEPDLNPSRPGNDVPNYRFLLADQVVSINHISGRADVFVNVFGGPFAESNYYSGQEAVARIAAAATSSGQRSDSESRFLSAHREALSDVVVDVDDAAFVKIVQEMQQHIIAGDVFQIVPSRTFTIPCADALAAYESLRQLNPSPYLFFIKFVDFALFGASPESAVKVDGERRTVEISPIAGTRARGIRPNGSIDREWDSRIEAELRLDEKENAEHMMLVDLARNDIARVSEPGSRHVAELANVVRYSHVMHLVSRVEGKLREGLDALHAYQASMNMGTLTGAPKIKAMQLIRQFERSRRGHYGGAVGYLRGDGSLDSAIVIRSALVQKGMAHVRAGAGVVHDSIPQSEADETRRKAEAVLQAIARANAWSSGEQNS